MTSPTDCSAAVCVLCVGQSTLDHVLFVPTVVTAGLKHAADGYQMVGGGVAANAAVAVARLGGSSILASCVGDDPAGRAVLDGLADERVDTHFVRRVVSTATPFSTIVVSCDGARTVFNHTPAGLFDRPCLPLDHRQVNAVLTDCRWRAGTQAALRHAHDNGVPCVVDIDRCITDRETRRLVFGLGTHLVFSENALSDTTGRASSGDGLRAIAQQTDAHVSVTLGERGVQWLDGDVVESIDAFVVDVVDTAAAGDVFHGAFALALAEGLDEPAGFRFAAAAAALKCSRPGARSGMPDRSAVDELVARTLTVTK
jgi:sulfofructose kinase